MNLRGGATHRVRLLARDDALRKNGLVIEFSLRLSRACLGKMFIFIYKWLKKTVLTHHDLVVCPNHVVKTGEKMAHEHDREERRTDRDVTLHVRVL